MRDEQGTRLLAARGWSRSGQSLMHSRDGVPELVGLYLWEWRGERWLPDAALEPVLERPVAPTGRRWWLIGPSDELGPSGDPGPEPVPPSPPQRASTAASTRSVPAQASWTRPDPRFLAALPAEPETLLVQLLAAHPPTRFVGALGQVARVLACGLYPAPVVRAMVDALTAREEITASDDVPDLWHRPCHALRHELHDGVHHDLLLDAAAGTYRGYREVVGADPIRALTPGTLLRADVLVTRDGIDPGELPPDLDRSPDPIGDT